MLSPATAWLAPAPGAVDRGGGTAHIRAMNVQTSVEASSGPAAVSGVLQPTLEPREYHGLNWLGFRTLYKKEVQRFTKIWIQTILGPVVTTLLYMVVFVVAMSGARPGIEGVSFAIFVAPGLTMMGMLNNAFANTSSSLMQGKVMGTAFDFLAPPISALELTVAFAAGGVTRGIMVGLATAASVWPFGHFGITHWWAVLYFGFGASLMLSLIGIIAGLWADKFDQMAAVTGFIVMPLTFLSGTFYLVERLPEPFRTISYANPFFYLIDGFRYGFIGHANGSLMIGVILTAVINLALGLLCYRLFRIGWKLKT